MDLWQFWGIIVSIFASCASCYAFFYKEIKTTIGEIRGEIKEIREEVKDIRTQVRESDKRWFALLEKMHMIDKDVEKLKNS